MTTVQAESAATTTGETFDSLNPATDEVVGTYPVHTEADVEAAVARAREAAVWWAELGFAGRADYDWARGVIEERKLAGRTILFSPVWGELDLKTLAEMMLADRVPARLQTQLHKHIWGADVKGV